MAGKSPEQKALEQIRRAERTRSTKLDLSELGLKSIPSALWRLTHLTDLRLNNNQLANLPDALGNLANLQVLYLDVRRGAEHCGARLRSRLGRDIEAACYNISAIWDRV